jgi:ABC-2 type transport system permease protein
VIEVCGLTRLIRTTFVAVPRRRAVLAAKAATAGAVALAAGEVLAFASFFLTQATLPEHHRGLSLAQPGVPGQRPGTRTSPD